MEGAGARARDRVGAWAGQGRAGQGRQGAKGMEGYCRVGAGQARGTE